MIEARIHFNPDLHKYTDENNNTYISVTQLIHKFENDYDSRFWAMYRSLEQIEQYQVRPFPELNQIELNYLGKRRKYDVNLLYTGIIPTYKSPDDILKEWKETTDESCSWGSYRHGFLEDCIYRFSDTKLINPFSSYREDDDYLLKVTNIAELELSPLKYLYPSIYKRLHHAVTNGWTIFVEKRVYSVEHRIAGTIDCLLVKGDLFHILDWKTNKHKLQFEAGYFKKEWNADRTAKIITDKFVKKDDRLLAPLSHLYSCKGILYTLQLSLYAYLCELWGYRFSGLTLCHIRPILNEYGLPILDVNKQRQELEPEFYKLDYLKAECAAMAQHRVQYIKD